MIRPLVWLNRTVGYMPVRYKLLVAFLTLTGVPLAIGGLAGTALASAALENVILERLQAEVETLQVSFDTLLRTVESDIAVLVASPQLALAMGGERAPQQPRRFQQEMQRFRHAKPVYLQLRLLDSSGQNLARAGPGTNTGADRGPGSQPFYPYRIGQAGGPPGTVLITAVELAPDERGSVVPAISFARGVYGPGGAIIAVLVADIRVRDVLRAMDLPHGTPGSTVMVVDREGRYLYQSSYREDWNTFLATRSRLSLVDRYPAALTAEILSSPSGGADVVGNDILSYRPILEEHRNSLVLVRSVPRGAVLEYVRQIRLAFLGLLVASLGLAGVLGYVAADQFTDPIRRLVTSARQIATGNYGLRVALGSNDELDELADAFNSMAEAVEQREGRIRSHADHLEQEVQQRTEELLRSERLAAVGEFVTGIAHGLGAPLNVISGYAEHLLLKLRGDESSEKSLNVIVAETRRIAGVVRGLQDFARPQTPDRDCVDLHDVIGDARRLASGAAAEAGVQIELDVAAPDATACVDALEIEQVIFNLLINAVQASPAHGVVRVTLDRAGHDARIRVSDQGPGVPAHLRDRIFEPFFTTKRAGQGTGLGLAIVRRIVERHDGSVKQLASNDGGCVFEIRLPRNCP